MTRGRVAGRVALVTGAASAEGIGFAAARRLAEEGAIVIMTDIDEANVRQRANSIIEDGGRAAGLRHDVRSDPEWAALTSWLVAEYGGLDILVNNAGILLLNPLESVTDEEWTRLLDVNLTGPRLGMKHAIPLLRARGGGSIINMSSVSGLIGVPNVGAYSATKGGLRIMSKCVAAEVGPANIRVNTVHPGFIMTAMQSGAPERLADGYYEKSIAALPLRRFGTPADVAGVVLFLASDESSYITGAEFVVDGGLSAV